MCAVQEDEVSRYVAQHRVPQPSAEGAVGKMSVKDNFNGRAALFAVMTVPDQRRGHPLSKGQRKAEA